MPIVINEETAAAALSAAAKAGWSSLVKDLLDAGADANAFGGIALIIAEQYGDQKSIDLLKKSTDKKFYKENRPKPPGP